MIRITGLVVLAFALSDLPPLFAQSALDRLEGRLVAPEAKTTRPQLGLLADERDLRRGVLVFQVLPNSPAERAGFQNGDQIIEIDGQLIRANTDIAKALAGKNRGDRFGATIMRRDRAFVLTIVLDDTVSTLKPPADELPPPLPAPAPANPVAQTDTPALGITLTPMTAADRKRYPGKQGAIIRSIIVGSLADKHKLPLGALIVGLDGQRITSPDDVATAIKGVKAEQEVEFTLYNQGVLSRRKIAFNDAVAEPDVIIEERTSAPIDPTRSALDQLEERISGEPKVAAPTEPLILAPKIDESKGIEPTEPEVAESTKPTKPAPDPLKGIAPAEVPVPGDFAGNGLQQRVTELEARIRLLEAELQKLKQPTPAGASE
ncbi:MAG: PDZ domain-containing protein [bacterium]|nr:PDZ domain-containing protein [bacterium]